MKIASGKRIAKQSRQRVRTVRSGVKEKLTTFITPMLATIHDQPFDDNEWLFEIKWDGYRAVAEIKNNKVKLYSRNGLSFLELYPKVAAALGELKDDVTLDGEIVVLNKEGKPDFQSLQQYDGRQLIQYYVFDCLSHNGKSMTNSPLVERKEIVKKIIGAKNKILKYSEHVVGDGTSFFEEASSLNLEGVIAKRANSVYTPGKRSRDWLKIKHQNTQEAIIAGYTEHKGGREYFGALILAIKEGNGLRYIGHTGTGFSAKTLKDLYLKFQGLKTGRSPFNVSVPVQKTATWLKPELVCSVKFTEITSDGILRHPVYMGLRIDKSAEDTTTIDKEIETENALANNALIKSNGKNDDHFIHGHPLKLTNQQKIYWPDEQITKGDVLRYYESIHRYILPYLKDRPQSLRRNPDGVKNQGFFQKEAGKNIPSWITTENLPAESAGRNINYIICNNLETLLYLNNLGCIELNPWSSRITSIDSPDYLVIDLDPSEENTFNQVIECALAIKEVLDKAKCKCYCKTSGASGLHIYIPLHAQYSYDEARAFGELVALKTADMLSFTTTERPLKKRAGRIYLDFEQNKKGQTLASVYSLRPKPGATVSTPLDWKEVKPGLKPSDFTIHNMMERLEKKGDIFLNVLNEKTDLIKCLTNLNSI